jgi:hypothetical protein
VLAEDQPRGGCCRCAKGQWGDVRDQLCSSGLGRLLLPGGKAAAGVLAEDQPRGRCRCAQGQWGDVSLTTVPRQPNVESLGSIQIADCCKESISMATWDAPKFSGVLRRSSAAFAPGAPFLRAQHGWVAAAGGSGSSWTSCRCRHRSRLAKAGEGRLLGLGFF